MTQWRWSVVARCPVPASARRQILGWSFDFCHLTWWGVRALELFLSQGNGGQRVWQGLGRGGEGLGPHSVPGPSTACPLGLGLSECGNSCSRVLEAVTL